MNIRWLCLAFMLIGWLNVSLAVNTTSLHATKYCSSLPLTLHHGAVHSFDTFPRALGSTIFFLCDKKYRLIGPKDMVCTTKGWSKKRLARCKVRRCLIPGHPENGRRLGNNYSVDAEVRFFCNSGFRLFGSQRRTCQVDGKWNGNLTTCDDGKTHCPNPGIPVGGRKKGDIRYNLGNVVRYSCGYGLTLRGSKKRQCQADGKWTGIPPICVDNKIPPISIVAKQLKDLFAKPLMATTCSSREANCSALEANSTEDPRLRKFKKSYRNGLDLIFVLDASSSVTEQYFKLGLELIKEMVRMFGIKTSDDGTRIACVSFGTTAHLEFGFEAESVSTTAKAIERISKIKFKGGGTATRDALAMVRKDIMAMARRKSKKAIMFLTDGNSNIGGKPASAARKLKRKGVEIHVIGVGKMVQEAELRSIASLPYKDHVFRIAHHNEIEVLIESITDFSECGRDWSKYRSRIVGGKYTQPGKWPWALLLEGEVGLCGASLLNKRWALTAAHCIVPDGAWQVNQGDYIPERYEIILGLTHLDKEEKQRIEVGVEKLFVHKNFVGDPLFKDDIALIKLEKHPHIQYTKYIQKMCLPDKINFNTLNNTPSAGIAVGWGSTWKRSLDDSLPDAGSYSLKEVSLPFVNNSICKERTIVQGRKYDDWYFNEKTMFCAGNGKGVNDTCEGDSGGPLMVRRYDKDLRVYRWYQVGITSWGVGCASENEYAYMTRVTAYLDWINETIKNNTP